MKPLLSTSLFFLVMGLLTFSFSSSALSLDSRYSVSSDEGGEVTERKFRRASYRAFTGDLSGIKKRRILRVLVTHSRTDFFLEGGRIRGAQVELIGELLKDLNKGVKRESEKLRVQFLPVEFHQLIPALAAGEGDIAAAFLTVTPEREQSVDFITNRLMKVDEVVVTNRGLAQPTSRSDLAGKNFYVLKDSSYSEHLRDLNEQLEIVGLPGVNITEADDRLLTEDILELVNAGIIDYTVCDDFKAALWAQVLPNLKPLNSVAISRNQTVGWAIRKESPELSAALFNFMERVKQGTLLGNILFQRYFKDPQFIDNPLAHEERKKYQEVIKLFRVYGEKYGFDPLALAAQAYQESKLDNSVRSHRGAVGIMQMMPATARDRNVDIDDIEVLENNIHAGVKYLQFLRERYFSGKGISPIDQRLFTWAAYNAGPANVIRIRKAARKKGLDHNVWFGNVEVMAARMISREPVQYVANIYKYYTAYSLITERSSMREDAMESHMERL